MFENQLKTMFPTRPEINYDIADLYAFIDALGALLARCQHRARQGPAC